MRRNPAGKKTGETKSSTTAAISKIFHLFAEILATIILIVVIAGTIIGLYLLGAGIFGDFDLAGMFSEAFDIIKSLFSEQKSS